jgi:hypothetical protein
MFCRVERKLGKNDGQSLKKWWFENDFIHVNAINHEEIGLQIIASKNN